MAASMGVALVMTPVLVRGLGKTEYGIWVLVGSTVLYLDLLRFGFGRATIKYVAAHQATGDLDRLRRTLATSFFVLSVPGAIVLAGGAALAFAFPALFDVPAGLATAATILVLLVAVDLAVSMPGDAFGGSLIGLQRYDLLNATLITVMILQAIAWAVVLAAGGGLVALGLVTVGLALAGQVARYALVRRLVAGAAISRTLFDRSLVRPLASLSAWISVTEISHVVISRTDTIVVGIVLGIPEAAVYAVGQKLALLAGRVVHPVIGTLFPYSSELAALGDTGGLKRLVRAGTRLSLAIALPVTVVLAVLARPALEAWVGSGFADATLVVVFLAGASAITALTEAGIYALRGSGNVRAPALMSSAEAGLNLVLSVVFAHVFGLVGVAAATLVAAAVIHLGLLFPYICRQFEVSLPGLLGTLARAHVPAAAAALAVGWLLRRADIDGILPVVGGGLLVGAAYLLTLFATGLEPEERRHVIALVRHHSPASP